MRFLKLIELLVVGLLQCLLGLFTVLQLSEQLLFLFVDVVLFIIKLQETLLVLLLKQGYFGFQLFLYLGFFCLFIVNLLNQVVTEALIILDLLPDLFARFYLKCFQMLGKLLIFLLFIDFVLLDLFEKELFLLFIIISDMLQLCYCLFLKLLLQSSFL